MARSKRGSKKRRLTQVQGACDSEDLISNLPESVLSHILSCLPTKQAVRTCVLSKDWRKKWTFIHSIQVNDTDYGFLVKDKSDRFSYFMAVLTHLRWKSKSSFKGVHLSCYRKYSSFNLSLWVSALLGKTTHTFELKTPPYSYPLSNCLHNFTSLTELKIYSPCNLKVPGLLSFNNLKIMEFGGGIIEIENEESDTDKLLLSFPVLQFLELENCKWLNVNSLEISAPELITLTCRSSVHFSHQRVIKISAGKLGQVKSVGSNIDNMVINSSSIYYAEVTNRGFWHNSAERDLFASRASRLLKGFPDLKYLQISSDGILEFQSVETTIFRCHDDVMGGEVALFRLLKTLPSLEFLGIHMWQSHVGDDDYAVVEPLDQYITSPLKEVVFRRLIGTPNHIHLAQSILKNVEILENMTVYLGCHQLVRIPGSEIEQQLSSFAKGSTRASIVVNDFKEKHAYEGSSDWIEW